MNTRRLSLRQRWRSLRLRDKLLWFYTAMISIIVLINVGTSYTAFNYMQVFNQNLTSYFNIHQLRLVLESNRASLERYLREKTTVNMDHYYELIPRVWQLMGIVSRESDLSLEAHFQIQATERGLDAYFRYGNLAIQKRNAGVEDYYATYVRAARIDNYISGYISLLLNIRLSDGSREYRTLLEHAMTVRLVSFLALLGLGIVSVVFGVLFANYVSRPVRTLADFSSRMAAGDLEVGDMIVESHDEIGVLAASFNAMSRSIREMVADLREKAILEKRLHEEELTIVRMQQSLQEAQFLGLQSQINPHFLFNTLNTISRTALFEHATETSTLIQSLSRLFRYHLRDSRKTVSLREELDILEEYLSIQKHRYRDRFEFSVSCSVNAEDAVVPCFTLQPLVENAVKYGIEPKEEGGKVAIDISRRRSMIRVVIRDDGIGMERQVVSRVLNGDDRSGGQTSGIGIPNVLMRLRLLYGGRERFTIRSVPGRGTIVILSIPDQGAGPEHVSPADS